MPSSGVPHLPLKQAPAGPSPPLPASGCSLLRGPHSSFKQTLIQLNGTWCVSCHQTSRWVITGGLVLLVDVCWWLWGLILLISVPTSGSRVLPPLMPAGHWKHTGPHLCLETLLLTTPSDFSKDPAQWPSLLSQPFKTSLWGLPFSPQRPPLCK